MTEGEITIRYRNHRGEVADRRIFPHGVRFDATEWHPEPQWLLDAYDIGKDDQRSFAMRDILAWDGTGLAARGPAMEANAWFRLEDRLPDEGRIVLLARYSGADADYTVCRHFRRDLYGPGGSQWGGGWRWAMEIDHAKAAPAPTPATEAKRQILQIASSLAQREGLLTTDDLPTSRAEIRRRLETQDHVVADLACRLGEIARSLPARSVPPNS